MARVTRTAPDRAMSFDVRPIEGGSIPARWHWMVYEEPLGCFVRNGQVAGDRDEVERAARAAIALLGGMAP